MLVQLLEQKQTKFVVGRILINQPPAVVWTVLANPFEFQGKICPRMRSLEVIEDRPQSSVMKCTLNVCFFLPTITYVVESKYEPGEQVQFSRVGGTLKDFRGSWLLRPRDQGLSTEVLYCMFVDPGIAIPRWLIREGVKAELPRTLTALRKRVNEVCEGSVPLEARSIQAANAVRIVPAMPLASRKGSCSAQYRGSSYRYLLLPPISSRQFDQT